MFSPHRIDRLFVECDFQARILDPESPVIYSERIVVSSRSVYQANFARVATMPVVITCHSCGHTLHAPDRLAGRKAKCGSCGSIVVVNEVSIPEAIVVSSRRARIKPKPPAQEEEPEWAVPVDAESVPHESGVAPEENEIVDAEPAEIADAEPAEDDPAPVGERRRRKRRKKKRHGQPTDTTSHGTAIWWGISIGVLTAITLPLAIYVGNLGDVVHYAICIAVMLPVSLVVLIVSMFATSYFGGGVDFGEIQTAIPKALLLLFVMNFVAVVLPWWAGFIFGFPLFFILVLVLFHLDFWEAGFLSFANSQLNQLIFIFAIAALLHGVGGGFGGPGRDALPSPQQNFGDEGQFFPDQNQAPFQENDPRFEDDEGDGPQQPKLPERSQTPKKTRSTKSRQSSKGP
jgi:hypothetical protein